MLDCTPRDLGHDRTIVFYNDSEKFHWEVSRELCDVRSGVICSPNNFLYDQPLAEGMLRVRVHRPQRAQARSIDAIHDHLATLALDGRIPADPAGERAAMALLTHALTAPPVPIGS